MLEINNTHNFARGNARDPVVGRHILALILKLANRGVPKLAEDEKRFRNFRFCCSGFARFCDLKGAATEYIAKYT